MNKEEILNKYIDLIDKGYCSDCNELNCIDNFPHAKITHGIRELQQENQKYKEVIFKIKMIISARIKEYQKKIDNEIDMGSQGDHFKICRYEENIKFLKDILKEVKTC